MNKKNLTIYIATCNKTQWVLEVTTYLLKKYVPFPFKAMGFNDDCDVRLAPEQNIEWWSVYIGDYLRSIKDEYLIFMLDDFFITGYNEQSFIEGNKLAYDRFELGYSNSWAGYHQVNEVVREYDQSAPYRISCQPSIWKREYLIKYLTDPLTPWEFEQLGSKRARADMARIIYTIPPVLTYSPCTGLSKQWENQINHNGVTGEDFDHLHWVAKRHNHTLINI